MTRHLVDFTPAAAGGPLASVELDRRQFLIGAAALGGGLAVGILPLEGAQAALGRDNPGQQSSGAEFTGVVSIAPDNTVTIRTVKCEIGNGVHTGMAMIVTEELQCDWSLVRGEYMPPNRNLRENNLYSKTGALAYFSGRSTGKEMMEQLLQIGASARERLRLAAAQRWNVPVVEVAAANSVLTHAPSGRKATYGEVAAAAAAVQLDKEPALKPRAEWSFLGKASRKRMNLPFILDGSAKYGLDIQVPGMVYAAVRHVPAHGGRLKRVDADKVRGMPGVRGVVIIDPDEKRGGLPERMTAPMGLSASTNGPQAAVAVIADHFWQAKVALDALPVEWDPGEGANWPNTQAVYDGAVKAARDTASGNLLRNQGDVDAASRAGKRVEMEFLTPYQDHFVMEPLNGTALVAADRCDVWISTQHAQQAMYVAADETGLHPEKVHVHATYVGVGFGRRIYGDDVRTVVAIARKLPGTPVKVIWTREETTRQGRYRDIAAARLSATLGDDGMIKALDISQAASRPIGRNLTDTPYQLAIPNFRARTKRFATNIMNGPFRGPVYISNCFFLETLVNRCAEEAKIDAVEYRRRLLAHFPDKGWIKALDEVAQKANWGQSLPRGTAQGVAIGNWAMANTKEGEPVPFSGSTVAAIVTVEVSRRGNIAIPRVDVAFDIGSIINPDAVRVQMEGGVIAGLSAALNEELNVANGAIVEGNLDGYRVLRQADPLLPQEIHVHFGGNSGHERFSEAGEPPMGPPPPAFVHAYFRATGKWITRQPFLRHLG
jgi:isoquinoline 1-oxidoreductase beta subunit